MKFAFITTAIDILRPNASYELSGDMIASWNDPRPQPLETEIEEVLNQLELFDNSNYLTVMTENGETVSVDKEKFFKDLGSTISS